MRGPCKSLDSTVDITLPYMCRICAVTGDDVMLIQYPDTDISHNRYRIRKICAGPVLSDSAALRPQSRRRASGIAAATSSSLKLVIFEDCRL